ncbi:hypothetical protein HY030_02455, partial [Candidatus Gottesmanbacteria bacterium]|nr:hypothetical protein [Candidatus Gottesmanbacteria bacterium]
MRITKNIFTLKSFFVFTLIVLFFGTIGMVKKETWAASPSSITPNSINSNGLGYPPIGDVINTQLNPNQSLEKWIAGGRDSLGVWTQRGVIAVTIEGLNCQMDGCPTPQQLSNTSYNGGGAIGFTSNLLDVLFVTKPISSIQYFSLLKDNVMGITPAYAQNLEKGTNGLDAIFDIWSIFRNIS